MMRLAMTQPPAHPSSPIRPATARALWELLEPYHAVVYFAPAAREVYAEAGLRGGWMGYFASRAAAMGPVGPEVVVATFHNFQPAMVRRAIPDAWALSTVERVLAARDEVADRELRRLCGDALGTAAVAEAAVLARTAVEAIDPAGRPLGAAHAALPVPAVPHLALWRAVSALREHRFDGHVAVLVGHGVDGCEALVLAVAAGDYADGVLRPMRGWSEAEWGLARERLEQRRVLDSAGRITEAGTDLKAEIEWQTDVCATRPLAALGEDGCARLLTLLGPLVERIGAGGGIPAASALAVGRGRYRHPDRGVATGSGG
jgi:hypothetical protein